MEDTLQGTSNTVEEERRGWNANQCRHEVQHQLTLGRRVRCQSSLLSHQRVSWKGTWSSHEGFPQMGGALHSLAWAGPLHPSPDCRLSAETLADQLSYAGRGKVNSTCNGVFILSVKQLTCVHVLNRLTSGLMLVFDRPGLSRSRTISLMACSIRSLREEKEEAEERGERE